MPMENSSQEKWTYFTLGTGIMQSLCLQVTFRKLVEQRTVSNTVTDQNQNKAYKPRKNLFQNQSAKLRQQMQENARLTHFNNFEMMKVKAMNTCIQITFTHYRTLVGCQQVSVWT